MIQNQKYPIFLRVILAAPLLLFLMGISLVLRSSERTPMAPLILRLDQTHQELVNESEHDYQIITNGTLDMKNTREVSYAAVNAFEMTTSLKIENVGSTAIHNPRIVVNGEKDWADIDTMLAEIIVPDMSEREKALAIWKFVRDNRYHYLPAEEYGDELHDPVVYMNVYGYGFCDDSARNLAILWQAAGLKSRLWVLSGHVVSEVWYEGKYHMLDADTDAFYLMPDNHDIASVEELQDDGLPVKRTHHYGPFSEANVFADESVALLYGEDDFLFDLPDLRNHVIQMTLKPGESFEWRWNEGRLYHDIMYHEGPPPYYSNGKLVYTPDLDTGYYSNYLEAEEGLAGRERFGGGAAIHVVGDRDGSTKSGFLIQKVEAPYVLLGGKITVECNRENETDRIYIEISEDGQNWQKLWQYQDMGRKVVEIDLDSWLASQEKDAKYSYYLKFGLSSPSLNIHTGFDYLSIETDVQMAPLSLPSLSAGKNIIRYTDETEKPHQALITYRWIENNETRPPEAPREALLPRDGEILEGNRFDFSWQPAEDPDGDEISAYHILVSDSPAAQIPLSPNFDRVVNQSIFNIPGDGLLSGGETYYWKVRARDSHGVWGDWSKVWNFTASAPGVPLNIHVVEKKVLVWKENPNGNQTQYYEVYASPRKGFIPSKGEVQEVEWGSPHNISETMPPNYLGRVSEEQYTFPDEFFQQIDQTGVYFRVIAIDRHGNASAPSQTIFTEK